MEILSAEDLIIPEPQILHSEKIPAQPVNSVDKTKIVRRRDLYFLPLCLCVNPEHFFVQLTLPKDHRSSLAAGLQAGMLQISPKGSCREANGL